MADAASTLEQEIRARVRASIGSPISFRRALVVPAASSLSLSPIAKQMELAVAYCDLVGSSALVESLQVRTAARIIRLFLECTARIARAHSGEIRSFDGDRLMMVFAKEGKSARAVHTALKVQWMMSNVLVPAITTYSAAAAKCDTQIRCVTGIDVGEVHATKVGLRSDNDLVWLGRAPNLAAKLSGIREGSYGTWITKDVHDEMEAYGKTPRLFRRVPSASWDNFTYEFVGRPLPIYGSRDANRL